MLDTCLDTKGYQLTHCCLMLESHRIHKHRWICTGIGARKHGILIDEVGGQHSGVARDSGVIHAGTVCPALLSVFGTSILEPNLHTCFRKVDFASEFFSETLFLLVHNYSSPFNDPSFLLKKLPLKNPFCKFALICFYKAQIMYSFGWVIASIAHSLLTTILCKFRQQSITSSFAVFFVCQKKGDPLCN